MSRKPKTVEVGEPESRLGRSSYKVFTPPPYDPEQIVWGRVAHLSKPLTIPAGSTVRIEFQESSLTTRGAPRTMDPIVFPASSTCGQVLPKLREAREKLKGGWFRETAMKAARALRLVETGAFDFGLDQFSGVLSKDPDRPFLQLLGGPFSKQMYLSAMLQQFAAAFYELHHNPIANRAVHVKTDFVVGKGVRAKFDDEAMQEAWDEWADRDKFPWRLWHAAFDLCWQGELMWRMFQTSDGLLEVREVDPSTVWEVISYPSDTEKVIGFWQVYPGPTNIYTMPDPNKPGESVPMSEYVFRLIPFNEMLHVKVNDAYGEKRGRSDLYPSLTWGQRIVDFLAADAVQATYERSYSLDIEIEGDAADVERIRSDPQFQHAPKAGTVFVHNKAMKATPISASVGAGTGRKEVMDNLVRMFAAGPGIPAEYLGFSGDATKAASIAKTTPFTRMIEMRQLWIETQLLRPFVRIMRDTYARGGKFGITEKTSLRGEFTWPEAAPEDVDVRVKRLAFAEQTGVIDHETYAEMVAGELRITDYDYAQTQKDVADRSAALGELAVNDLDDKAAGSVGGGAAVPTSSQDRQNERTSGTNLKGRESRKRRAGRR